MDKPLLFKRQKTIPLLSKTNVNNGATIASFGSTIKTRVHYSIVITAGILENGLYIVGMFPWEIFHPSRITPLIKTWKSIRKAPQLYTVNHVVRREVLY